MRIGRRVLLWAGMLAVAGAVACGGLAHSVSDDGNDITNPKGANPGTPTLTLSAARTDLGVGDNVAVTAVYAGMTLNGGGATPSATVSDSSVIAGSAFGVQALSVGNAYVSATYNGSTATLGFTVHSQYGVAARVTMSTDFVTGTAAWLPRAVRVQAGSTVEFAKLSTHDVVFAAVTGAPPNIAVQSGTGTVDRAFPTAGTFPFSCSVHGETGTISVLP